MKIYSCSSVLICSGCLSLLHYIHETYLRFYVSLKFIFLDVFLLCLMFNYMNIPPFIYPILLTEILVVVFSLAIVNKTAMSIVAPVFGGCIHSFL